MSTSKMTLQFCLALTAAGAMLIAGCAKPAADEETATVKESKPPVELAKHSEQDEAVTQHELVGVWLGRGSLDQSAVGVAIEGLSAETQRQVNGAAEAFLATEMAIEFKADGKMETAIEVVNKQGQRESGVGIAVWEASQTVHKGEYRVTSIEEQLDGSKVTDHKTYRVSADGQTLVLLVDLPGLLGQCNPRIVLKRQDSEEQSVASNSELQLR
jgi:hypothetical protein